MYFIQSQLDLRVEVTYITFLIMFDDGDPLLMLCGVGFVLSIAGSDFKDFEYFLPLRFFTLFVFKSRTLKCMLHIWVVNISCLANLHLYIHIFAIYNNFTKILIIYIFTRTTINIHFYLLLF